MNKLAHIINLRHRATLILLLLALVITSFVYHQGLYGPFIFDDFHNIVDNQQLVFSDISMIALWQAACSGSSGPLGRPISMASFAINIYFNGLNPYYFKLTNLVIHLFNGIGIFVLTGLLLKIYHQRLQSDFSTDRIQWVSLAVAATWLLHPLNITSVLYVVQRMASLSALFTISGLIVYLLGRRRLIEQRPGGLLTVLAAILIFTPLAAFSKEIGILLPAFMFAIEAIILNWQTADRKSRCVLIAVFVLMFLSAMIVLGYILLKTSIISSSYSTRDFSMPERLMTEARVLCFYLRMILIPDISSLSFYHDDMAISHNLFSPPTTMLSIAVLLALVICGFLFRNRYTLLAFGLFFFLIGHSMESSVFGLELVHEHRNYLPMFGILLTACYYTLSPTYHPASLRLRSTIFSIVILSFAVATFLRANHWSNLFEMQQMEVINHPQSPQANSDLAVHYATLATTSRTETEVNYRKAIFYYSRATALSDTDTAGLFGVITLNAINGLSTAPNLIDELEKRLEYTPFTPISINALTNLEKCQASGICSTDSILMDRLISASLRNPTLNNIHRSITLFIKCDFLYNIMHQPHQAEETAYLASATMPQHVGPRLMLIQFLIDTGKHEQAGVEIQKARDIDRFGVYGPALAKLEHKLAEIRARLDISP